MPSYRDPALDGPTPSPGGIIRSAQEADVFGDVEAEEASIVANAASITALQTPPNGRVWCNSTTTSGTPGDQQIATTGVSWVKGGMLHQSFGYFGLIVPSAGVYDVKAQLYVNAGSNFELLCHIYQNGSIVSQGSDEVSFAYNRVVGGDLISCAANDVLTLGCYCSLASATVNAGPTYSFLAAVWVSN